MEHSIQAESKVPRWRALAVLSSVAISSLSYATEDLFLSLPEAARAWAIPISIVVCVLMAIVTISYRQVIRAYPEGGGAYTVTLENLGIYPGLMAGAALLIGFLLAAGVSVSAAVSAIVSVLPGLGGYRWSVAVSIIAILCIGNLRGWRECSTLWTWPTYVFLFAVFSLILTGILHLATSPGLPGPLVGMGSMGLFQNEDVWQSIGILLRGLASGCAVLAGIAAVSNRVPAFEHPGAINANKTLSRMALATCAGLVGITVLAFAFGCRPDGQPGMGSVLSQLVVYLLGPGVVHTLFQAVTAAVLIVAANTCFNGFPWVAAAIARDRYLPRQFSAQGDRGVYLNSILGLAAGLVGVFFILGVDTHAILPLYAMAIFLVFTLSQIAMARFHWNNRQKKEWWWAAFLNGVGGLTTAGVVIVILATTLKEGAWVVALLIPFGVWGFTRIKCHYEEVGRELGLEFIKNAEKIQASKHSVVVPISGLHRGVLEALRYSISISNDVRAVYVQFEGRQSDELVERLNAQWKRWAPQVPIIILKSRQRSVIRPVLKYLEEMGRESKGEFITVIIPEFVPAKWHHRFLHNQTAFLIRAALILKRNKVVTTVRYHLKRT